MYVHRVGDEDVHHAHNQCDLHEGSPYVGNLYCFHVDGCVHGDAHDDVHDGYERGGYSESPPHADEVLRDMKQIKE